MMARVLISLLALLAAQAGAATEQELSRIRVFEQAEFLLDDRRRPAVLPNAWTPVRLPDDWNHSHPGFAGIGWYRIAIDEIPDTRSMLGVHLPHVSMGASVYFNDNPVGDTGREDGTRANGWYRPLLFRISQREVLPTGNHLYVRVVGYPNMHSGLAPVQFGDYHALQRAHDRLVILKVHSTRAIAVFIGSLGLLFLALWSLRREDLDYLYFGLASTIFAAGSIQHFVRDELLPSPYWGLFIITTIIWGASFYFLFALRFAGLNYRGYERSILLYVAATPWILLAAGASRLFAAGTALISVLLGFLLVAAFVMFRKWRRDRSPDVATIAISSVLIVPIAAHDLMVHSGRLPIGTAQWMMFGAAAIVASMGYVLIRRFALTLRERDELIDSLERRVEERSEQLHRERGKQLVLAEREGIMRRIHDGVATDLALALTHLESGVGQSLPIRNLLQSALDEARFSLNALSEVIDDLPTLLGHFRQRIEPTLLANGIDLQWAVSDTPPLANASPQQIVDINMIVKEAVKNVISHARASWVRIETGVTDETREVFVSIIDDGNGFDTELRGIGLNSMEARAAACGGRLELASGKTGTCVKLLLPYADDARPAMQG